MTPYQRVIQILDNSIGGPAANIGVHGAFWRGLTRDQFVARKIFNKDLITLGHGAESNLVKSLKGEAPFGVDLPEPPAGAQFSRMPAGFDPVPAEQIAFIQQWIDDGCPAEPPFTWRPTNAPTASRTDDVWFNDPDNGWAVNANGQIVHTADGGNSWTGQLHEEDVYFRCIGFSSPKRGWAGTLTPGKTLYFTRNGGQTWSAATNLPPLAPPAICGLSVVSDAIVYASGTNFPNRPARMMKTEDGGATWTAWSMKPWADLLIDCYFLDAKRGWVVGGKTDQPNPTRKNVKPVVLFTDDGGVTWTDRAGANQPDFPLGEWGWKIQILDERLGFVSLENYDAGAILKTVDGGLTWTRHPVNDPQKNANLEGIGFIDENHGWVGGWGDASFQRRTSSATSDGGLTWRDANEIGKNINRFRFFGKPVTVGYSSGETVYKLSSEPAGPPLESVGTTSLLETTGSPQIPISVPEGAQRLTVRLWDRFGAALGSLLDEDLPTPGERKLEWDRTHVPPGHYIVRITIDGVSQSRLVHLR